MPSIFANQINSLPDYRPEDTLPGAAVAGEIVRGIALFSLIFCVVGLVLSAGLWAIGSFSNNHTQSVNGKKGFLICAGSALAIGAAQIIVKFFGEAGLRLDPAGEE